MFVDPRRPPEPPVAEPRPPVDRRPGSVAVVRTPAEEVEVFRGLVRALTAGPSVRVSAVAPGPPARPARRQVGPSRRRP